MAQTSIAGCNAALDAINALLNGGTLEIRSGDPADIDSAPTGSVLVAFTLPNPCFSASVNRVATANAISATTSSAANAGGAVHFVVKDSSSNVVDNGTAGLSGTDMILNTLTWQLGDDVNVVSWTKTLPKG